MAVVGGDGTIASGLLALFRNDTCEASFVYEERSLVVDEGLLEYTH